MKALPTYSALILLGFCVTSQASPICHYYDLWQSVQGFTSIRHYPVFPKVKPHVEFEILPSEPDIVEIPTISLPPTVPEPSSLFVMAVGLAGMGLMALRRGSKKSLA
jgi:hypothetical protein